MYLTRFRFNTARPGCRRLLSSPQRLHAAVMGAFPGLLPGSAATPNTPRVLWRLDQDATANVQLYVSSPDRPDLTHLVEQAGWPALAAPDEPGWQSYDYQRFLDKLVKGTSWQFRLTANPVHSVITGKAEEEARAQAKKTGEPQAKPPAKRTAHLTRGHQMAWLLKRQESGGFRILEKPVERRTTEHGDELQAVIREHRTLDFSRGNKTNRVKVVTVTYEGRLDITDPDALRRALTQGIGKAKAYGCGLMTLAPVGTP